MEKGFRRFDLETPHRAATDQDWICHRPAVGQREFDLTADRTQNQSRADNDPRFRYTVGTLDPARGHYWQFMHLPVASAKANDETDAAFARTRQMLDARNMQRAGLRAGVNLGGDRFQAEIGQGDMFAPADPG